MAAPGRLAGARSGASPAPGHLQPHLRLVLHLPGHPVCLLVSGWLELRRWPLLPAARAFAFAFARAFAFAFAGAAAARNAQRLASGRSGTGTRRPDRAGGVAGGAPASWPGPGRWSVEKLCPDGHGSR